MLHRQAAQAGRRRKLGHGGREFLGEVTGGRCHSVLDQRQPCPGSGEENTGEHLVVRVAETRANILEAASVSDASL